VSPEPTSASAARPRFLLPIGVLIASVLLVGLASAAGRRGDDDGSHLASGLQHEIELPTTTSTTAAPTTTTTAAPTTTTTVARTTVPPAPTTAVPPTTTTTRPHPARVVIPQAFVPFATVGSIVLQHPSDHVEAIGFHQSAQDGAQEQTPVATASRWFTMEDRERDTTPRGAADIVVEPGREIRAPVTGTVIRANSYTLYCDYTDQYVVIEPDSHPGWEVKILHIEGLTVTKGQRVQAGVTVVAQHARVLPFRSQVEDDTGLPPWPHVHVEVVDPTVKDRPTGPGCS
jgi:biotin carboxyl carrier protein